MAAYMENCDSKLVKAFGEDYECYYFYYALNQKTESNTNPRSTQRMMGAIRSRWVLN